MTAADKHPVDLSPYLDRDYSDRGFHDIQQHLTRCAECREEVRLWEAGAAMFRASEAQIDVPLFQWQRILARLEREEPVLPWPARLGAYLFAHRRAAWSTAMGLLLVVVATFSGLWYQQHRSDQRILALIAKSDAQWRREAAHENPFRALTLPVTKENPFEKFLYPTVKENPFALRQ